MLEYLTKPNHGLVDESGNPMVDESGVTMNWGDPPGSENGGISRITRPAIYKKDLYGNWQQISDQASVGYAM